MNATKTCNIYKHWIRRGVVVLALAVTFVLVPTPAHAVRQYTVELQQDSNGWQLLVDSEPFPIQGVVWAFTPIGENYNYELWDQPEKIIRETIDRDARLLTEIGVNTIRSFSTIPPRWVEYLHSRYGIYTIVNYVFGRYGISVNGKWYPNTDYAMPATREKILREAAESIETYKNTNGVLMFMFGNENNYGLQWESNAIENLPVGQRLEARARFLYSLFEEAIVAGKQNTTLPIGIVNGDTQYLNVIAEETPSLDIYGANVYRGQRSSDLFFESVRKLLDKPIVYTEFGADAFNVRTGLEDQYNQALYLRSQWKEIYEQAYGKGKSQNMLGGFIFEWIDEWWKHSLDTGLYEHDTVGTWQNGAYYDGGTPINNMNEEWFGIVGQSEKKRNGVNVRLPRAAYYMMEDVWAEDLYSISTGEIAGHFGSLELERYVVRGEGQAVQNQLDKIVDISGSVYVAGRGHFSESIDEEQYDAITFSNEATSTLNVVATPNENLTIKTTLRAQLGALDDALTDSYSYLLTRQSGDEELSYIPNEDSVAPRLPVELYSAAFKYDSKSFEIQGYYHDGVDEPGHADYFLQGDFFYLYPETFDRAGIDLGLSKAPFGVEFITKGEIEGFSLFIGPEIFWGAEPALYAKFYRELFDRFYLGIVHYEAFRGEQFNSGITDTPLRLPQRKSSLYLEYGIPAGAVDIQIGAGALLAGTEFLVGEKTTPAGVSTTTYTRSDGTDGELTFLDTLGGKVRLEALVDINPVFNLYAEYIYAGLVASSRGFLPRAGTQIVDSGAANRQEVIAGGNLWIGDFVISPKFRWRTPIEPPDTSGRRGDRDVNTNAIHEPVRVDGGNREILQAELVLTYDMTGATWFHEWNNDDRENALFAASLGFLYTIYQGPTDRLLELFNDPSFFGFGTWETGMTEQSNLWNLQARAVSNFAPVSKIIATFNTGMQHNIGRPDTEPEMYYAGSVDLQLDKFEIGLELAHNAFGPEDWHFNQNIRAPWQLSALLAYHLGIFSFIEAPTKDRIGMQFRGRWLEEGTMASQEALNTLGNPTDVYRMEVTLFYELTY